MKDLDNRKTPKEFHTRDLSESAAILSCDIKLLRLEEGQGFYYFVFEDKDTQAICDRFWSGDLVLSAKKFNDSLRTLKDRLFARR